MKRTILSVAIGSAFAAAAGSALALMPTGTNSGVNETDFAAITQQVYMSGATAQNGGIEAIVRRECQSGTLDLYADSARRVYVCNSNGNIGTAGSVIAIHKEGSGSSAGIDPVKSTTASLAFLNLSSLATGCPFPGTAVASVAAVSPDALGLPAYTSHTCTSATTSTVVPDIGFTDVDPALFAKDGSGLNLYSPNQLIFGIGVTTSLRDALQAVQSKTVGSDAFDQQPTLTSGQIAAIFQGRITKPSELGIADAALAVGGYGTNSTANQQALFVARRGTGSGTQATTDAFFLNARITNTANTVYTFKAANYGGTSGTTASDTMCGSNAVGPTWFGGTLLPVFAGKGNDDVVNCLNRHEAGKRYGIALLTSEYNQFASPAGAAVSTLFNTGFRYIAVDGFMPTIANVIKQNYLYFSEQVVTSKSGLAGIGATVRDRIVSQLGDPNVVTAINAGFTIYSTADAGEQTTGLLGPGRTGSCKAKFAVGYTDGVTPDNDPVNYTTKNPTGTKVINALHVPHAVCPPRF